MSSPFHEKWGVEPSDIVVSNELLPVLTLQFVATVLLLYISRPKVALVKVSAHRMPDFSWSRAIALATLVVCGTLYFPRC